MRTKAMMWVPRSSFPTSKLIFWSCWTEFIPILNIPHLKSKFLCLLLGDIILEPSRAQSQLTYLSAGSEDTGGSAGSSWVDYHIPANPHRGPRNQEKGISVPIHPVVHILHEPGVQCAVPRQLALSECFDHTGSSHTHPWSNAKRKRQYIKMTLICHIRFIINENWMHKATFIVHSYKIWWNLFSNTAV